MNGRMLLESRWRTAAVLLLLSSVAGPLSAQERGSVAKGARQYGAVCGSCHNARSPLERTDRQWVTIMNHMRVRANLTGDQVRDVLAFLQATNTDPRERAPLEGAGATAPAAGLPVSLTPSTDPEIIADGERLVSQKACLGCHVVRKQGGQVGPSLNGVVQRKGVEFVWQKVADPTINNATSLMPNLGLSEEEIAAIIAFLNTLDGGDE